MMNYEKQKDEDNINIFMDYHKKNKLKKELNKYSDVRFFNNNIYRQKSYNKSKRLKLQLEEWDSRIRVYHIYIYYLYNN